MPPHKRMFYSAAGVALKDKGLGLAGNTIASLLGGLGSGALLRCCRAWAC